MCQQFPATAAGYRQLLAWFRRFGTVVKVGVEGTGAYGAGLARYLTSQKIMVVEVDRPDRKIRRTRGKSDPIDALAAARAALSGQASGVPKTRTGPVEAIHALRVARNGAVKARTAAVNQLHGLLIAAPEALRAELAGYSGAALINRCAALNSDDTRLTDVVEATKAALRAIAARIHALTAEITLADRRLRPAVTRTAPTHPKRPVRCRTGGRRSTPDHRRRQPRPAALRCRPDPPLRRRTHPGQQRRHRPSPPQPRRRPSREQRAAHHRAQRMRYDPRTRAYLDKRTKQGLSKEEIMRCLIGGVSVRDLPRGRGSSVSVGGRLRCRAA